MRINRVLGAGLTACSLFAMGMVTKFGDATAANDLLSLLTPQARAAIMSETALLLFAGMAFAWFAYELHRDAGRGESAYLEMKAIRKEWLTLRDTIRADVSKCAKEEIERASAEIARTNIETQRMMRDGIRQEEEFKARTILRHKADAISHSSGEDK